MSVTGACGFDRLRSAELKGRSSQFKRKLRNLPALNPKCHMRADVRVRLWDIHKPAGHLRWSERKESSTAGSASIRSPSVSMPRPSSASGSIRSESSEENGSISNPGTPDRAFVISLDSPDEESPETHANMRHSQLKIHRKRSINR